MSVSEDKSKVELDKTGLQLINIRGTFAGRLNVLLEIET
jgi:hypothetical protein